MKPFNTKPKKHEHQSVVKGHPYDCGGCRRRMKIRVRSKKAARRDGKLEALDL
jgi:hypothetical protein